MGTSASRHGDLASNEYLEKFAKKDHISPNEPFWNRFLSFSFTPPATRYRHELLHLLLVWKLSYNIQFMSDYNMLVDNNLFISF
jgi:hypothetical protein